MNKFALLVLAGLLAACNATPTPTLAAGETVPTFGLSAGASPNTLCVFDKSASRSCVPVGVLDSTAHTFVPSGGPQTIFYASAMGVKCDGVTDDTNSIAAAITTVNSAGGGVLQFPAGTCMIGSSRISLLSKVYMAGQGAGATVLKAITNTYTFDLFDAISQSYLGVSGFTIDNTNGTQTSGSGLIGFRTSTNFYFSNNALLGVKLFGVIVNNGTLFNVNNNYCSMPTPLHTQNECFLFSIASGQNSQCSLDHNTAIGSGVNTAGLCDITNNYISGWGYGAGITVAQNASTHNVLVADNYVANGSGPDVNSVKVQGMEIWAQESIIRGNRFTGNCGNGADVGGMNSIIQGNYVWNNGTCAAGAPTQMGLTARYQGAGANQSANGSIFIGNYAWDDGAGVQLYGFGDQASGSAVYLMNNYFSGPSGAVKILGSTVAIDSNVPTVTYSAAGTALPSCSATVKGLRAIVSDATAPTYHGNYVSGGAVVSPVLCNGVNWITD